MHLLRYKKGSFMPVRVYDPVAYLELSTHKVVMSTNYTCPADCDAIYHRMKANTNGGSRAAKVTDNVRKMIGVLAKNIQSIFLYRFISSAIAPKRSP